MAPISFVTVITVPIAGTAASHAVITDTVTTAIQDTCIKDLTALLDAQEMNIGQEVVVLHATPNALHAPAFLSVLLAHLAEHSQVASAS